MNWRKSLRDEIDWIATLVPLFGVLSGLLFLIFPILVLQYLAEFEVFLGDQFSIYYAMLELVYSV